MFSCVNLIDFSTHLTLFYNPFFSTLPFIFSTLHPSFSTTTTLIFSTHPILYLLPLPPPQSPPPPLPTTLSLRIREAADGAAQAFFAPPHCWLSITAWEGRQYCVGGAWEGRQYVLGGASVWRGSCVLSLSRHSDLSLSRYMF